MLSDSFIFDIDITRKAAEQAVTRRSMLSTTASLFDPLGFLSPVLLIPKMIMQQLCRLKLDWDELAPDDLKQQWLQWIGEIPLLQDQRIHRCLKPEHASGSFATELHDFFMLQRLHIVLCVTSSYDRITANFKSLF